MRLHPRPAAFALTGLLLALLSGACDEAGPIPVPTLYLVGGQVADPTTSPFTSLPGATVRVETAPEVGAVTTDTDGIFLLHGVPAGVHRLRAELPGRRTSRTIGIRVDRNVTDAGIPLFTDGQIDSILVANGAPAWDRAQGLLGLFALRSNGLALGAAAVALTPRPPHAGGTLVQSGDAADPILIVNAVPGDYQLSVSNSGFLWDNPYPVLLQPGVITFGVPRARPNIAGFVFNARSTGNVVDGAGATVLSGPTPASATTGFLGQFSLVGLERGRYVVRMVGAGYLPGLTWPQELEQDTTLTCALVHPDTLAAWSAAQGGPAVAPDRGHVAVEARSAAGGALLLGATLAASPPLGGTALPQTAAAPALLINLVPGTYTISISGPGIPGTPATQSVTVRGGEVTYSRLDL